MRDTVLKLGFKACSIEGVRWTLMKTEHGFQKTTTLMATKREDGVWTEELLLSIEVSNSDTPLLEKAYSQLESAADEKIDGGYE